MDIGALLAEAADDYNDDGDFENEEVPTKPAVSAGDILKASANAVAHDDKIEARKVFQKQADVLVQDQRGQKNQKDQKDRRTSFIASADSDDDDNTPPHTAPHTASEAVYVREPHAPTGRSNKESDDEDEEGNPQVEVAEEEEDGGNDDDDNDIEADPELDTELLVAAYQGNIRKVVKLLSSGARYNARDRHRWTALMWAAAGGFDDILGSLINCVERSKLKKYLNAKDSITGWSALHVSDFGSCDILFMTYVLKWELGSGNQPIWVIGDCRSPHLLSACNCSQIITIACTKGRRKCVQVLVHAGANKESKSFLKETPLDCLNTADAEDRRIITKLLGGKVDAINRRRESKGDD